MMKYSKLMTSLLICAALLLCSFESASSQRRFKIITISLADVDSAEWDEYGPGHEGDPLSPTQIWMRAAGHINFRFTVDQLPTDKAIVSVKLSSELGTDLQGRVNGNPRYSSDVTLSVNGNDRLTQNVIADDTVGKYYAWNVPASALKKGENTLTFLIKKTARNRNGITFFTPIKIQLR